MRGEAAALAIGINSPEFDTLPRRPLKAPHHEAGRPNHLHRVARLIGVAMLLPPARRAGRVRLPILNNHMA